MRHRAGAGSRGPNPHDLRAATRILVGPAARRVSEGDRAAELLRHQDPEAVWHFWEWNRVRLLATHRARQLGVEQALWDERAGELAALAKQRGLQQELAALKVSRVLARDGVRSVVLKGAGLAKRLYGDPSLRDPSTDVDVLVAASNLHRASELLRGHGWTDTLEALTQGDLPELHFAFFGPDGMPPVELHWRMQWYDRHAHTAHLLERAEEVDGILRPATADLPHLMLLFWLRDGFHGLRLAADYAAAQELDGDAANVRALEVLAGPLQTARAAAEAVFRSEAPALGSGVHHSETRVGRRQRLAQRVARSDSERSARQVYTQSVVTDLLAGRGGQWQVALSKRWLRDEHALAVGHPDLPAWLTPPARAVSCGRSVAGAARLLARAA